MREERETRQREWQKQRHVNMGERCFQRITSHPRRLDHRASGTDEAGESGRGLATEDLRAECGRWDFTQKAVGRPEESEQERARVRCVFCKGHFGSKEKNRVPILHLQQGASSTSL